MGSSREVCWAGWKWDNFLMWLCLVTGAQQGYRCDGWRGVKGVAWHIQMYGTVVNDISHPIQTSWSSPRSWYGPDLPVTAHRAAIHLVDITRVEPEVKSRDPPLDEVCVFQASPILCSAYTPSP